MNQELTPRQQASEAIRQAETILIITGQRPTIDQAASTLALALILRKFGKKVSAIISDGLPAGLDFLPTEQLDTNLTGLRDFIMRVSLARAQVDKLKYTIEDGHLNVHVTPFQGGFEPRDVSFDYGNYQYDLAIVLGVPSRGRMDRLYNEHQELFGQIPIVNVDFHRSNENYGAINLVDPLAAGLGEILVALSESLQAGMIDEPIATALLTGMMVATDRFTAIHTTAKSLTVAAQFMAAGAKQPQIVKALYHKGDGRSDTRSDRRDRPAGESPTERSQRSESRNDQPVASAPAAEPVPAPTSPVTTVPTDEATAELPVAELLPPSHIEPALSEASGEQPLPQKPQVDQLPEAKQALDASYQAELHPQK